MFFDYAEIFSNLGRTFDKNVSSIHRVLIEKHPEHSTYRQMSIIRPFLNNFNLLKWPFLTI